MVLLQWKNHYNIGGLGSAVADLMAENGIGKKLIKIGLNGLRTWCFKDVLNDKIWY